MELMQRILGYSFETDELNEVGEMTSAEELFSVLNHLLQSNDSDQVRITLGFIRDFMIMNRSPEREEISDRYPESSLVQTIEQLLFCPNHFTRKMPFTHWERPVVTAVLVLLPKHFITFEIATPFYYLDY